MNYIDVNGTAYHKDTPKGVINVLELARPQNKRVRKDEQYVLGR